MAVLQFIPIIRYKAILFHRINGYAAILFFLAGNAGAFMIIQHAVGGHPAMQVWIGLLGVMTTIGIGIAVFSIKRLQIDQHRAWMLRVWTWAASIASLRLLILAATHVTKSYGYVYYSSIRCAEIYYMYQHVGVPAAQNPAGLLYPICNNVTDVATGLLTATSINPAINTNTFVTVSSNGSGPENVATLVRTLFLMSAWLAVLIHAIAIEVYLWLTPAEHYRLRNVSYQRQVEAGIRPKRRFRDAGLTATSIGDAPEWWSMSEDEYRAMKQQSADLGEKLEVHERIEPNAASGPNVAVDHGNLSGSDTEVESTNGELGSTFAKQDIGLAKP